MVLTWLRNNFGGKLEEIKITSDEEGFQFLLEVREKFSHRGVPIEIFIADTVTFDDKDSFHLHNRIHVLFIHGGTWLFGPFNSSVIFEKQ